MGPDMYERDPSLTELLLLNAALGLLNLLVGLAHLFSI